MIFIDYLKKYALSLLTVLILGLVILVVWQLYNRVYAPLFVRSLTTTAPEATQYRVAEEVINQTLQQLQNKQTTPTSLDSIIVPLTPPPLPTVSNGNIQARTEGITIDETAP